MIAGFNLLTMQYIYKNIGEYFIQVLNFRIYAKHGYLLFCFGFFGMSEKLFSDLIFKE